ncbi:MAG: DUF3649 domain-containing protein [Parvibaculaceae bacterium]|nr:DUF3649 domain-containing protein [Parvibaculaceae bacterium]
MSLRKFPLGTRASWSIASRVLAAIFGGYALAFAFTAMLALLLPVSRPNAAVAACLFGFIPYLLAILWVFSVRSATRAWAGLFTVTLSCAAVAASLYFLKA